MQNNEPKKRHKAGLHKEISSIFKGVPIPGGTQQPSDAASPEQAGQTPVPTPSLPQIKPGPVRQPLSKEKAWKSSLKKIWKKITDKLLRPEEGVSTAKQKVMLLLVPVLFIALIFVLLPLFKSPSNKRAGANGDESTGSAARPGGEINWKTPVPYPVGLRDPMQPGSTASGVNGTGKAGTGMGVRLIVKGIVYSKESPVAVIGTQLVHEGDTVSNATIVKINQDHVEFKMNDKRWTQRVE